MATMPSAKQLVGRGTEARGISPLEALDGREHRAAGEMQERLERGGLVRGLSRGVGPTEVK